MTANRLNALFASTLATAFTFEEVKTCTKT